MQSKDVKLKIAIESEALCGSAFFSLLKKFIGKLEVLCAHTGVCSIANIELGEQSGTDKGFKTACFDVKMEDGRVIRIATSGRTLDNAISNAFDQCADQILTLRENRA